MVKTNRSTLHMLYNIQQSATQDGNHDQWWPRGRPTPPKVSQWWPWQRSKRTADSRKARNPPPRPLEGRI